LQWICARAGCSHAGAPTPKVMGHASSRNDAQHSRIHFCSCFHGAVSRVPWRQKTVENADRHRRSLVERQAKGLFSSVTDAARKASGRTTPGLQRQGHRTIHFSTILGARPYGWEYPDGDTYATLQLPGALRVNSAQTYEAAALAGLGLIQAPLLGIGRYLESGALVEIIPDFRRRALAVSLVVAHRSNLSRRVRRCRRSST
jgi:hypothetical protein